MKLRSVLSFVLGFALLWIPLLMPSAVSQNLNAGQIERTAQRLAQALQDRGFEVNRGYAKLWTADDCQYTVERIGLCMGNNPAAPYVVVAAPPWPNEATLPQLRAVWGPSPPKYEDVFRLDPREALIVLVQMPPPARFFSEQTWVFTRQGTYDVNSDTYKNMLALTQAGVLPDFVLPLFFKQVPLPGDIPERVFIASMLSNPINNVVIERQAGTSFGQPRYFIITPDDAVNTAVRSAFAEIGVANTAVFTDAVPSNLKVGLDLAADDFVSFLRYAQPDDGGEPGTASYIWRKSLPIAVLRVRHTSHQAQAYPAFTTAQLEPRTAFNEHVFQPDLMNLISAVSAKWGQPCTKPDCSDKGAQALMDFQTDPIWMVGTRCTPIGENCLLDNWDASYQIYGRFSVDHGEVYALAGTLGFRTGNAAYVGVGINKASQFVGVANLSDVVLRDTAAAYDVDVVGNKCPAVNHTNTIDCMFLYYFTRDCSVVTNFTGEKNCFSIGEKLIPQNDSIVFSVRDYLRQGTERGPDSSLVLPPVVIRVR